MSLSKCIRVSLALKTARRQLKLRTVNRSFSTCTKTHSNVNEFSTRPKPALYAGQPISETRPYMMQPGELTPGITALEYFHRRVALAKKLPANSIAIVIGNSVQYASGSVFYQFQQNNDLYYLSGWNEPDSVIVIEKPDDNLDNVIFHMIVPPKEPSVEQWDGHRTGLEGAYEIFNADEMEETYKLGPYLAKLVQRNRNIYVDMPKNKNGGSKATSQTFKDFFSIGANSKITTLEKVLEHHATGKSVKELNPLLCEMRAIKSEAEIAVMRRAGQISGRAYNQAYAHRFRTERTLRAALEYNFIKGGCDRSAYIPVVAAGRNALFIHYTRNDDVMYDDEMVLVDAAGSLGGYCADISRTWPITGRFSDAQRDLYQAVLNVQHQCIKKCSVNQDLSLQDIHDLSVTFFKRELSNIGMGNLTTRDVTTLYPHYIGHNLGLDVHDTPNYSRFAKLRAGQVITIEPGLYVPDDLKYPAWFRNIGIRIEDNIAVGEETYTNLTVEAAKEIADVERIAEVGVTTPGLGEEVVKVF
ncbi:hypothetical protein WICPIJ_002766 [Wickerhamomyces pijperi]|uniref:Aminopeptidase P N-terminal domain-containing protein n=1 Tax=Wickerhamomyces pijperi TaxID=599730 RepID=A0A9P8TPJ2_WICPI|nr:hypothetical protein WICPIJ_002766 [Wickerhamomyces pijperi]